MTATMFDMRIQLVGPAELTRLLGVSRTRLVQLSSRPDFPEPVAELVMGKVWALSDVQAWAGRNGRQLQPLASKKS